MSLTLAHVHAWFFKHRLAYQPRQCARNQSQRHGQRQTPAWRTSTLSPPTQILFLLWSCFLNLVESLSDRICIPLPVQRGANSFKWPKLNDWNKQITKKHDFPLHFLQLKCCRFWSNSLYVILHYYRSMRPFPRHLGHKSLTFLSVNFGRWSLVVDFPLISKPEKYVEIESWKCSKGNFLS